MLIRVGAAFLLLAVGFGGGFCLVGSTHHSQMPRGGTVTLSGAGAGAARMSARSGADGEGGQRGGMAEAEGEAGAAQGGAASEGGGKGQGQGQERSTARGGGGGAENIKASPEPKADAPAASQDLLTGNTLTAVRDNQTTVRYLSAEGWQGVTTRPDEIVVKRWVSQAGQLCAIGPASALTCEGLTIEPARQPSTQTGAVLGTVTTDQRLRWTILRGNAAGLPTAIPLIGGEKPMAAVRAATRTLSGEPALKALLGRTWLPDGRRVTPVGDRFEPDGRWIRAEPLDPLTRNGRDGVRLTMGRWIYADNVFCLDGPGLELNRTCYRVEQWGPDAAHLVAERGAAVTRLVGTVRVP